MFYFCWGFFAVFSQMTPGLPCFMPSVTDFKAKINNNSIILNWKTDALPANRSYCDKSRRFQVRISVFDTLHAYETNGNRFLSDFLNTSKRRETNFTMPLQGKYTLEKYYIFIIRNGARVQIHTSNIFYFGYQGEALTLLVSIHCAVSMGGWVDDVFLIPARPYFIISYSI